ncbi:hypothetical protein EV693_11644 [Nicoletella semolina]|uniref:Uncharacterized protein n=1 Tax=Nicoletella semolina TaxID=271160 RepID=A0A4R2N568_9PAST|nr:hypothetical protein [Nicoletella semolina]TCP15928.1 hypothetical protein EV693_11644 [Nicoletella semolina]
MLVELAHCCNMQCNRKGLFKLCIGFKRLAVVAFRCHSSSLLISNSNFLGKRPLFANAGFQAPILRADLISWRLVELIKEQTIFGFFIEFHIFPILWYSHCFSSLAKTKNKIFTYFERSRLTKYAGGGG